MSYEGNIDGWTYGNTNPHPLTDNGICNRRRSITRRIAGTSNWRIDYGGDMRTSYERPPTDCVIHKSFVQSYLKRKGKWPLKVEGLRESYWGDDEQETGTLVESDTESHQEFLGKSLEQMVAIASSKAKVAIASSKSERKRALTAICDGDNPDEVMKLLLTLTELEDSRKGFEKDLCRVKNLKIETWAENEKREEHILALTAAINEIDNGLDNYQETGSLEGYSVDESKAEALGDAGASNQTEPKPFNNPSNDKEFSGLLNIPKKKVDWFSVIDNLTNDFNTEHGNMPNKIQVWGALCTSPPKGYEITTGTDKGEDCLKMPGAGNLGKRAFVERWKKYTAKIHDKTF